MIEFWRRKKPSIEGKTLEQKQDEVNLKSPKVSPEILNDWDKENLEKGLTSIAQQMLEDFNGKLPDAILYPETSARPLFFAMQPILEGISRLKNLSVPRSYAYNAKRTPTTLFLAEYFKRHGKDEQTTINTTEEMEAQFKEAHGEESKLAKYSTEAGRGEPEKMKPWRDTMRERAEEILDRENKLNPTPRFAVIDDFATEQATTANEVRRAFNMPNMHFYAVMGQVGAGELTEPVTVGIEVDPHQKETMNPSKSFQSRFTFSHMPEVGVTKDPNAQKRTSRLVPSEQVEKTAFLMKKKQLQQEMRAIGRKVADRLEKEFEQKS